MALIESTMRLYMMRQEEGDVTGEFKDRFLLMTDTINAHGGQAGYHEGLYK